MAAVNLFFNISDVHQISLVLGLNLGKCLNLGVLNIKAHHTRGPNTDAQLAHLCLEKFMVFFINGIS